MNGENRLNKKAFELKQGAIRAMFDKARTMENVISMGIGEPDLDTPAPIIEKCAEALQKGFTHYPPTPASAFCGKPFPSTACPSPACTAPTRS